MGMEGLNDRETHLMKGHKHGWHNAINGKEHDEIVWTIFCNDWTYLLN